MEPPHGMRTTVLRNAQSAVRVKDLFQVFPVWVGHILQRDSVQTSGTGSTGPVPSAPSLLTIH